MRKLADWYTIMSVKTLFACIQQCKRKQDAAHEDNTGTSFNAISSGARIQLFVYMRVQHYEQSTRSTTL